MLKSIKMEISQKSSYFYSITNSSYTISEVNRHYDAIKHLESKFQSIHNLLPNPYFFDEVVNLLITCYQPSEFILGKLNELESIVQIIYNDFSEERIEVQNNFLDGFFTLYIFDKIQCEKIVAFVKELCDKIPYLKEFEPYDLYPIFKIGQYHALYPHDRIRTIDSYSNGKENKKYLFDPHELFLHLYIDEINPVLLTDKFFHLKNENDLEAFHLLINGKTDLNTSNLKFDLKEEEYSLLSSQNHPPLAFNSRHGYNIQKAVDLVRGLIQVNLPKEMIYRVYFDVNFATISLPNKNLISLINEYVNYLNRTPTFKELFTYLKFQSDIPVDRKLPLFTSNEVRYLFKREMSLYFKNNLSVFTEHCQFCKSLSQTSVIHFEWLDENNNPQFRNLCVKCLDKINMDYMMDYFSPF